jgi:TatD DNase family protein
MTQFNADNQESPALIDTHCHLDDDVYAEDLEGVLKESRSRGVDRWINVGFAPDRWDSTLDLTRKTPGMSHMLGLHPGHAGEWSAHVSDRLVSLVASTRPVAIGEIGLDFFRGETNVAAQRRAFDSQLELAVERELPAVIHMRAAEDEVLDLLRSRRVLPRLVFHSFEGSARLRDFVLETGSMIGFGGIATRSSAADLREVIRTILLDQIVLETDSPYLIPKGARGRRNVPGNIPIIADVLAGLLGTSFAEVASATTRNAERIFGLARIRGNASTLVE